MRALNYCVKLYLFNSQNNEPCLDIMEVGSRQMELNLPLNFWIK